MRQIIWWVRRDLRLADNVTLHHALQDSASVIPVFILDPHLVESEALAPVRRRFLFDSLRDLDAQLWRHSSRLILRRGDPTRELIRLVRETGAEAVYFHRDYTPYARVRDEQMGAALEALGVRVEPFEDNYMAPPGLIVKPDGSPYVVYTPFRRRFEEQAILPGPLAEPGDLHTPPDLVSLDLPDAAGERNPQQARGGETEGRRLARAFLVRADGLKRYRDERDRMARDATSHLSPHLHFGTISVREWVRAAHAARAGEQGRTWIDELVWREFFAAVMWHLPHAAGHSFRTVYETIAWENDPDLFEAWCQGCTGYPVVDAGMRQLNATGWMHNRARLIVASFLVKDLLVDWRWGERYFLQHLVDGDVASNNGGWQWSAGTGTDAQPFFRVLNPVLQGKRFDPDGEYVKRWVPELERVPARHVHEPWRMPAEAARQARFEPGRDYALPVVDHALQRERALALYRSVR